MKTYKSTFIAALFGSLLYAQSALAAPTAASVIAAAEAKAATENKNVFVMFHASWCVWCHRLDHFLERPEIAPIIDANYVTVHIDIDESDDKKDLENSGGNELLDHLGGKGLGIPYCAVLSPTNETLAISKDPKVKSFGSPFGDDRILLFVKMLRATSHNLSASDADLIGKKLTEATAEIEAEQGARMKVVQPIQDAMGHHDYKAAVTIADGIIVSRPDLAGIAGIMRYEALLHVDEDKALSELGQPMGDRTAKDADGIRAFYIIHQDSLSDRAYNKALSITLAEADKRPVNWAIELGIALAYSRVHRMKEAVEHQEKAIEAAKAAKLPQRAIDKFIKTKQEWESKG